MVPALLVFGLVVVIVIGVFFVATQIPRLLEERRLQRRLEEVGPAAEVSESELVQERREGPLPGVDRLLGATSAGPRLATLLAQAGSRMTPGSLLLCCLATGLGAAIVVRLLTPQAFVMILAGLIGGAAPVVLLFRTRTARMHRFEEQFPDALDLLSRAIRAGHAFQAAMGMVATELPSPVGPEFKRTFEQQNFGLPLRDAMNELADRVPLLDVRFFVTAVAIQRESGGNLAEILDNLAHVVRERFKIRRQVRVHTAHGRFTGYVLLGLPAFLAIALSFIAPEQMKLLFYERLGQMMVVGAMVLQTIGFFWIRQVIKIEV
jgi:tight adherence protein B